VSVTGNGTVTGPNGLRCAGICTTTVAPGVTVMLTEHPGAGSGFVVWGSACGGAATTCSVTMNGDRTVAARFDTQKTLTIRVTQFEKNGAAGVQGPGGRFCNTLCTWTFNPGTPVQLTADAQGLDFLGWGGACISSGTNAQCDLTMNVDETVTADFQIPGGALKAVIPGTDG
jgi:hypothetical protein